jgi:hypothetical protein
MTDIPPASPVQFVVHCAEACPYFAEIAAFCWGNVDYVADGDAQFPTDREWRHLRLDNRATSEWLALAPAGEDRRRPVLAVRAATPALAARATYFLIWRTDGRATPAAAEAWEAPDEFVRRLGAWDVPAAIARSLRVRNEFGRVELMAFDSRTFWDAWRWAGAWATPDVQAQRLLMTAVLRKDRRGVPLAMLLLRQGAPTPEHAEAYTATLARLTGLDFPIPAAWIEWYTREGHAAYPAPDWDAWLQETRNEE